MLGFGEIRYRMAIVVGHIRHELPLHQQAAATCQVSMQLIRQLPPGQVRVHVGAGLERPARFSRLGQVVRHRVVDGAGHALAEGAVDQGDLAELLPHGDEFAGAGFRLHSARIQPLAMADHGVENFVILQPFGGIPNHVSGRGVLEALREHAR